MKLRCERTSLVEALGAAARAVSTRSSALPALSGLRLEVRNGELHVAGTDLDLTIQVQRSVGGATDGVCVAPAKLLSEIVRAIPDGEITLEVEGDKLHVEGKSGKSHFAVSLMAADDFPRLPEPGATSVELPANELAEALRQVCRAASTDEARPILTGVLVAAEAGGLRLVATDSYRLALCDLPSAAGVLAEGQKVLVPAKALREVERLLGDTSSVHVFLGEREAHFVIGNTVLTTRLIEGEFPNYRQLLPEEYPCRLHSEDKGELLDALRRVKLLVKDSLTPVRMAFGPNGVVLTVSQESGQATEEVEGKYEGTEMTIAFNPEYLIQGIEAVSGSEVILSTVEPKKPATIKGSENDTFLYLLMPVRVA